MLAIYRENDYRIAVGNKRVDYADAAARSLFAEGSDNFQRYNLQNHCFIASGQNCYVIPWMGDKIVNTITSLLIRCGFKASSFAGVIEVEGSGVASVQRALKKMLLSGLPSEFELAAVVPDKYRINMTSIYQRLCLLQGMGHRRMIQKERASGCRNTFSKLDM